MSLTYGLSQNMICGIIIVKCVDMYLNTLIYIFRSYINIYRDLYIY